MGSSKKNDSKKKEVRGDERFAAVGYDPRFQRFPKAKSKIKVDDRFKGAYAVVEVWMLLLSSMMCDCWIDVCRYV